MWVNTYSFSPSDFYYKSYITSGSSSVYITSSQLSYNNFLYVLVRANQGFSIIPYISSSENPPVVEGDYAYCTFKQQAYAYGCFGDPISVTTLNPDSNYYYCMQEEFSSQYFKFYCDGSNIIKQYCSDSTCNSCYSPTTLNGCSSTALFSAGNQYYSRSYTYSCDCNSSSSLGVSSAIFMLVVILGLLLR